MIMAKTFIKKLAIGAGATLLLLTGILCVHIYIVTHPGPPDAHMRTMARFDFKQNISDEDAAKITEWLYMQQGVDHVLCNTASKIAVFTFHPAQTNANEVLRHFHERFACNVERFLPNEADMKKGCPVAANSPTYKMYNYIKHIF